MWGGDVSATAEKAAKRRRKCERRKEIAVAPMSFIASPKNAQGGEGLEPVGDWVGLAVAWSCNHHVGQKYQRMRHADGQIDHNFFHANLQVRPGRHPSTLTP